MNIHAEELRCECCGGPLKIVCAKNGCDDPLEARRKSNGPVANAPPPRTRSVIDGKKRCSRYKEIKPVAEFYFNRGKPISNCKPCWNQYLAERVALRKAG